MRPKDFDPAVHVAHMEKVMGLTIEEAWRPSVIGHMAAIARAADLAFEVELPEEIEPAPVFRA